MNLWEDWQHTEEWVTYATEFASFLPCLTGSQVRFKTLQPLAELLALLKKTEDSTSLLDRKYIGDNI